SRPEDAGSRVSRPAENTIPAAPRRWSRSARRDSWWDGSARAHPDAYRYGWKAAPARPPSPAHQADLPPSAHRRTAASAAGLAGDRYTGWSDDCRADRPARRFAGERRYRSTCAPWRFLAGVLLGLTCREADYCRSTRFFKVPIFSTSSSLVSPCSSYQPTSWPQPLQT